MNDHGRNELRVFISSTFRDLQEEREHLIKKIFPEIRSLCRARGITFTEVDLRWGLTDEDVALGQVIRTWIEEAVLDEMSITEMEAQYGVLRRTEDRGRRVEEEDRENRALFYFRRHRESLDDADAADEERGRLEAYQGRIRQSGAVIEQFRDPGSLGELIYDDLL